MPGKASSSDTVAVFRLTGPAATPADVEDAIAAEKSGDNAKAREHYKKVVEIADAADKARTDVAGAQAFLQKQ